MELSEKHVIKHSAAVQITNTISLLQRKAWNVLLANAYDRLPKQDFFEVDISELIEVLKYDSKDVEYLKQNLETLMQSIVEWDVIGKKGNKTWKASVLLANVEISGNTLIYSYSPMLKELLYNPATYAKISLAMQSRFKSKYALALYELFVDFFIAKFGKGETPWIDIEDYKKLLDLENNKMVQTGQFKRLSQKYIAEPIKEINAKSDLFIDVEYKRQGRKVAFIKFKISPNHKNNKLLDKLQRIDQATKQAELPLENNNHPINMINRLEEYGLTPTQAKEIVMEHDLNYITEVLDHIDIKIRADKIENISAYTYKALKEDYRPKRTLKEKMFEESTRVKAEIEKSTEEAEKLNIKREMEFSLYRQQKVDNFLDSLDSTKKEEILELFKKSLPKVIIGFYEKDGLESIIIKKALTGYICDNYLKDNLPSFEEFTTKFT